MLKVIILEGPRGTGKSTVGRLLRDTIEGATLMNPTGFGTDGADGLHKITEYYQSLDTYLHELASADSEFVVIFDRTFFSEWVYSRIYKSYNFTPMYDYLLTSLLSCAESVHLFFLSIESEEELAGRLSRDKVKLFNHVDESVAQSTKQQQYYKQLFDGIENKFVEKRGGYMMIDTTGITPAQVKEKIMEAI